MTETKKNRDIFVDVAKGIAMLSVIRIHTEMFSEIGAPYPIIAVPLFFFLSGFYDNTRKPLREWLPKAFKRLFLVGIAWVMIGFVYLSILSYVKSRTISISFTVYEPLIANGVVWFLFALFYAKLCVWLIHKSKLSEYIVLTLLVLLSGITSNIDMPFLIDEGIAAIPFYYAGRVCYPIIKKHWNIVGWCAAIGVVCMMLMRSSWFPYVLVPYSNQPALLYPVFFLMTICSFTTVLWISKKAESLTWLANFGKQTMGILVLHPLMLHTCAIVLNRIMVKGSTPWIISFAACYIAVCILCYYCSVWITKHMPSLLGAK